MPTFSFILCTNMKIFRLQILKMGMEIYHTLYTAFVCYMRDYLKLTSP
jgi:hypothetical protein